MAFGSVPASAAKPLSGPYKAELLRIIDGDTIRVRVHVWLGQTIETNVRIRGIDTPELRSVCKREREKARRARDYLAELLQRAPAFVLYNIDQDKYGGRIVADIELSNGKEIAALMLQANYAHLYNGSTQRKDWC